MEQVKIICPSSKRPAIHTDIDSMIICVDEKELEAYKEQNEREIITHPGLNNLSKIRQFIYEKFGDVFMVDDDIISIEKLYQTSKTHLTPIESRKIIQDGYMQAKAINSFLFGFNNDPSPTHYNQHKPFMLNGYINGCAFGLIKNDHLYFDEKTIACESHWINLLNAYHNRFCFIDKRFHFRQKTNSTFTLEGGQSQRRTLKSEEEDTQFLKKMFGDSVNIKTERNQTKRLHEYQRELNIRL
jgi:hypothetical protein